MRAVRSHASSASEGATSLCSSSDLDLVERERRREAAVGVDLLLSFGELLLGLSERISTGDETERRPLFGAEGQQRLGELRRVPRLLPVLAFPEFALGGVAVSVVLDRR